MVDLSSDTSHWRVVAKDADAQRQAWNALTQLIESLTSIGPLADHGTWVLASQNATLEASANRAESALVARVQTSTQVTELFCLPWGETELLLAQKTLTPCPAWWDEPSLSPTLRQIDTQTPPVRLPHFLEALQLLQENADVSSVALESELLDAKLETQYLSDLVQEQAQELHKLRERLRVLSIPQAATVDAQWDSNEQMWLEEPDLSRLEEWATDHSGLISIAPRAYAGAKKSLYAVPKHVYQALLFLAGPYREHRLGLLAREPFERALERSGCQLRGSIGASVAGEQGEAYFLKWGGRRRFLDLHLARGGGRDERYCLRVYFFWDDELKQCVVGWLPSHLSNSLS